MLKKTFIIISLIICMIPLSSCGDNTEGWPRISLPFESKNVYKVNVFHEKENVITSFDTTDENNLDLLCDSVQFLYKEKKESEKNLNKYHVKIEFTYFLKNESIDQYKLSFYNKGISNGYVVFNNEEIHFFPGDIETYYNYWIKEMGETK